MDRSERSQEQSHSPPQAALIASIKSNALASQSVRLIRRYNVRRRTHHLMNRVESIVTLLTLELSPFTLISALVYE